MHRLIHEFIYTPAPSSSLPDTEAIESLCQQAFVHHNEDAKLSVHRILYVINTAHLARPWQSKPHHLQHPKITQIKYQLETSWELSEQIKHQPTLATRFDVAEFSTTIQHFVSTHHSNELHPIFTFLCNEASYEQMREFFWQESPLEMMFGDILAFLLPGSYGQVKIEFLKNYWDEVGHASDARIHRNLRGKLMDHLHINRMCYVDQYEFLICEELELANLYLSLATNRAKHTELLGVLLATELMIPNRFQYSIDGWRRLGLSDNLMEYLIEHTSVDEIHAQDWLEHVVCPIIQDDARNLNDILFGIVRRLALSVAVLDRLYDKLRA